MEDFAWASLYKNWQIKDNLENKVWECYSVPYRYAKKNILKSKPERKFSNRNNRNKNSKVGKKRLHKVPSTSHIYSRSHSDDSISDDSDYEDNIPLQIVQEGLNAMSGESPSCGRTRIKKCLHKERVIKCKIQRELWDLEDYEAIAPKIEHKPVTKPEYRSLGVQPFSLIDNKKQICEVLVSSQFNKDKSTIKVNEGQKMTEVTRTSTPKNNKVYLDCRIELSPIQKPVHSTTVQPSFSEHADISDKHNASKLNLYSDDSSSDESDYEDNIPLKVVQEGLNAMSRESPICDRTRNTNRHDLTSQYDWMKLNKKFIQCAMWDRLQTIVKEEMGQLLSLPGCFIGDTAVDRDQVDIVAKKGIPSDILQRFNVHYPICIVPDGNCFCRSISQLVYGSEDHHVEMKCRIVIDSVLNLKNYTDHDYLMRCVNHEHKNCSNIAGYYCCYSGVKNVGNRDESLKGIQSMFREDVMRICSLKEYCGPW